MDYGQNNSGNGLTSCLSVLGVKITANQHSIKDTHNWVSLFISPSIFAAHSVKLHQTIIHNKTIERI
jgi:hypothetical protein